MAVGGDQPAGDGPVLRVRPGDRLQAGRERSGGLRRASYPSPRLKPTKL